ncbi:hypothetical protein [Qipengyuania atrilutea]|uniref:Uncharacterized protein n=1 Tax=Qipengyuania atrilutea TaxID=2744473 RepID=A0A850GWV4_9SPHN|nr:hypothetical protein [Actirhodobacter atriluteus]NVD44031.1 hypothetical protein [Actirhodobacter atriluteus]
MTSVVALLSPLTLLLGLETGIGPFLAPDGEAVALSDEDQRELSRAGKQPGKVSFAEPPERVFFVPLPDDERAHQVRIERRVIIRISPRRVGPQSLVSDQRETRTPLRFVRRDMERCIPASEIIGARPSGERSLRLYLRDRRLVSLTLDKSCRAQAFYSGFYIEKDSDGQLCARRDELHSRTGSKCEVEDMHQLVALER